MMDQNITVSDLEIMTGATNYRSWMFRRLAPFIGQRILEVGAGIGNFTSVLLDRQLLVALDTYAPCVDHLRVRLGHHGNVIAMHLDITDASVDQLRPYGFDTVICLNVLEHVEDDQSALSNMYGVLQPGGRLVLLVPAFQFLYGTVDWALQHYRRYTRKDLLPKIISAGFGVEKTFYMNVVGMAGWFLNNRVLNRGEESPKQILMFDRWVAPWADRVERLLPPPFGLSLIAICRKS